LEETLKLAPLAVLGVLAPGRIRRLAAVDWILLGLACGMGFQASEDFVRQAVTRPTVFSLGGSWRYGWTLFGGRFDVGGAASYAGHHIETALVAAGIGLAVRGGSRKPWRWLWALPPVLWLIVVCDHAAFNAALADRAAFTAGRSTVPTFVHLVWAWTGHGFDRGWLLLLLLLMAAMADAGAQSPETVPRALAAPAGSTAGPSTAALERLARDGIRCLTRIVRRIVQAGDAGWHRSTGPARVRLVTIIAYLGAERRRREADGPPFRAGHPLLPTRVVAGLTGTLSVALAVVLAHWFADQIGGTLRPSRTAWFAGLLDGLGSWWDGLGPGGQALVLAGGVALLVLGGTLLLPEILAGGLGVAEGGLIVVGGAAGTSSVAVPAIIAGGGVLTMAAAGSAASGRGSDDDGNASGRTHDDAEQARLNDLARDPAHGGRIDDDSLQEARVARDLERTGRLAGLRRDPTGGADFIDGAGQDWDVKGFNSRYRNGYDLPTAMSKIADAFREGENVILDTTNLAPADIEELRAAVGQAEGWAAKIVWWP